MIFGHRIIINLIGFVFFILLVLIGVGLFAAMFFASSLFMMFH